MPSVSSKSESMNLVKRGIAREVFTHEYRGHFDVSTMREKAALGVYPVLTHPFFPEFGDSLARIHRDYDIDHMRVWELMTDPTAPWDTDPVIVVMHDDASHTLIDGVHRLCARWALRCPEFRMHLVPEKLVIRPPMHHLNFRVGGWGKYEVRDDGKLYDRETGALHTVGRE